jgi:hypothetical protein
MVNSVQRLAEMKKFMNKELDEWGCRAGLNSIIIRTDGNRCHSATGRSGTSNGFGVRGVGVLRKL